MSSVHSKLGRVRKPRVHIEYKVETGNATEKKHLPFLMGVVGDFSGNKPTSDLKPLRDRKFVNIDRDNINDVLKSMTPGLNLEVENTLAGDGSMMKVNLKFESMEDFSPGKVAEQVTPIKKLLDVRNQLKDLRSKIDVSTDLESTLEQVLKNTENVDKLAGELGINKEGE
ncbi:MAG: type VI secretion system contractile sheath small subunit [Pirellulaceae bacterium]|nr:type VI secretion system contractile sheath small subunit [Pirellulaceae bacterium]